MTSSMAEMTTSQLTRLIVQAVAELEQRSGAGNSPSADAAPTALSPVLPRDCKYCHAPIVLAATEANGEWIPLDETTGHFNLVNGRARWVDGGGSHAFHYDTCPGSVQNQPAKPAGSLFDELTQELVSTSSELTVVRGDTAD